MTQPGRLAPAPFPTPISVNDPPNELAETEIEKIAAVRNVRSLVIEKEPR